MALGASRARVAGQALYPTRMQAHDPPCQPPVLSTVASPAQTEYSEDRRDIIRADASLVPNGADNHTRQNRLNPVVEQNGLNH